MARDILRQLIVPRKLTFSRLKESNCLFKRDEIVPFLNPLVTNGKKWIIYKKQKQWSKRKQRRLGTSNFAL